MTCLALQVTKDAGLRERHLGDLQGVVFHEAAKVNPVAHKSFVSNQEDEEIPVCVFSLSETHTHILCNAGALCISHV